MIKSIFFAHFHTGKGPQVLYQVPDGSVTSSPSAPHPPFFDFDSVSDYIIPKQELCDRLVSVCTNRYRILGYPVCVEDRKYDRNEYIFNIAIVLEEFVDPSSYKSVVKKLATLFRALEEQSGWLWNEVTRSGVYSLIEQVMEDLNNYCECMIPINDSNAINIKLFPIYSPPPPVKPYHVPICTVQLELLMDVNWDLTMQRIIPYIDGINSVRRISELADADYKLTQKCIEHLLYYNCLIMVDIFQFSAIYAVTAEITSLVSDRELQEECMEYISTRGRKGDSKGKGKQQQQQQQQIGEKYGYTQQKKDSSPLQPPQPPSSSSSSTSSSSRPPLTFPTVFELYTSLSQGLTLKQWCIDNKDLLHDIDVRRFISFGIIKGVLYRVHKYPVSNDPSHLDRKLPMAKFLDGNHHFDDICTELQVSEREVSERLAKGYGDVQIVHR
ncbi:nitrogen permease regulator 2 [Peziza echinospora]|nr:nitrogen permease regulator 2 [Peziza echinospora]